MSLAAHARSSVLLSIVLGLSGACGGSVGVAPADDGDGGAVDGGSDGGDHGCPGAPPKSGEPCVGAPSSCMWPPPAGGCTSTPAVAYCVDGKWESTCIAVPPTRDSGHDIGPGVDADASDADVTDSADSADAADAGGGCPATMPTSGPCAPPGLVCGYGDDPRPACRATATCAPSGWQPAVGGCPPPPTEACRATVDAARGADCTTVGAFCAYGDVTCGCGNCFGGPCGGTPRWACPDPPTDPRCPRAMPNLGLACTVEGTHCTYGACAANTNAGRVCTGGVWVDERIACPL